MPRFTPEELRAFERQNIENMIGFYAPEMKRIAGGEKPNNVIGKPLIKRFLKLGILVENSQRGGRRTTLSAKGRELYNL